MTRTAGPARDRFAVGGTGFQFEATRGETGVRAAIRWDRPGTPDRGGALETAARVRIGGDR